MNSSDRRKELRTLIEFVNSRRRILSARDEQLIKASAGNWPISHLDYRSKIAVGRDKFDRSSLKNETLLNVVKVSKPRDDTFSVYIQIDPAFSDSDNYVTIKRPLFSLSNRLTQQRN